jgi:DNA-binding beta-propeller fold protein YncE
MALGTAALVALAAASGNFELPVVAGDARAGLSADGHTAVLAERPADGRSRFALVDRQAGRVERVISLRGDFGFDALSPDGSRIYVVHYLSGDHSRYAVQAMSANDAESSLQTVVEKGEPGERMSGLPMSRTTSPDGGWIYTLYDGNGTHPFIHALETTDQFTVCIDLDSLAGRRDLTSLKLVLGGAGLTVMDAGRKPLVRVNTDSYEATPVPAAARTTPARQSARSTSDPTDGSPYGLYAAIALGAALLLAWRTSRQRQAKHEQAQDLSH